MLQMDRPSPLVNQSPTIGEKNQHTEPSTKITKLSQLEQCLQNLTVPQNADDQKEHSINFSKPPPPSSCKLNEEVQRLLERCNFDESEIRDFVYFDPTKPYTRNLISTDSKTYTILLLCWRAPSPIHDHPGDACCIRVISGAVREKRYQRSQHANRRVVAGEKQPAIAGKAEDLRQTERERCSPDNFVSGSVSSSSTPTATIETISDDEDREGDYDQRFSSPNGARSELIEVDSSLRLPGQVSFMHDSIGLHSISPEALPPLQQNNNGNALLMDGSEGADKELQDSSPRAITLHIYMPPIKRCKVWPNAANSDETKEVEIPTTCSRPCRPPRKD